MGATTDSTAWREDERDIVTRVQAGDKEAFGQLVAAHMQRAYYAALGLVGSHDDALDLSQEAFVRAFRARDRIDPERPFYTWYYQILRRLCFNLGRDGRSRRQKLDEAGGWLEAQEQDRGPREPLEEQSLREMQRSMREAIDGLPVAEREIIVLREFEDRSYREIAELLDIPMGTVMSRLYAARKKLANRLVIDHE